MCELKRKDLIYPELSYQIINCAYKVHNTLGGGLAEKDYQKALAIEFANQQILVTEQFYIPLSYCGNQIRKRFCDYLVDKKIVVEIKSGARIKYVD